MDIMTSIFRRAVLISAVNEGPIVNIAAWLGMTAMVVCILTRIWSKFYVVRKWTLDDTLIIVTMGFAVAHTVTLSLMVSNGLGQPQETLTEDMVEKFQKFGYASQLLYIPALALAKLSTLVYLRALAPGSAYAVINVILEGVVILWGISAEFAIAFQCKLPDPWAIITSQCLNRIAFWDGVGALDIVIDLAIIFLPAYLVWDLQMPKTKKFLVFLVFGTRILIAPLTIVRMYYLSIESSPLQIDQILTSYHAYLFTTIQLNTAIFMACIPFLKPFLENLGSGALSSSVEPMDSAYASSLSKFSTFLSTYSSSKPHPKRPRGSVRMSSLSESKTKRRNKQNVERTVSDFHFGTSPKLRPDKVSTVSHIRVATPEEFAVRPSVESGSERMIITRTTEWNVREEIDDPKRNDGTNNNSSEREWRLNHAI